MSNTGQYHYLQVPIASAGRLWISEFLYLAHPADIIDGRV